MSSDFDSCCKAAKFVPSAGYLRTCSTNSATHSLLQHIFAAVSRLDEVSGHRGPLANFHSNIPGHNTRSLSLFKALEQLHGAALLCSMNTGFPKCCKRVAEGKSLREATAMESIRADRFVMIMLKHMFCKRLMTSPSKANAGLKSQKPRSKAVET